MNNMMSTEYLEEVLNVSQGRAGFWIDTNVPVHLRNSLLDGERIFVGNLSFPLSD